MNEWNAEGCMQTITCYRPKPLSDVYDMFIYDVALTLHALCVGTKITETKLQNYQIVLFTIYLWTSQGTALPSAY